MEQIRICISKSCNHSTRIIRSLDDAENHQTHKFMKGMVFIQELQQFCQSFQPEILHSQIIETLDKTIQQLSQIREQLSIADQQLTEIQTNQQFFSDILEAFLKSDYEQLKQQSLTTVIEAFDTGIQITQNNFKVNQNNILEQVTLSLEQLHQESLKLLELSPDQSVASLIALIASQDQQIQKLLLNSRPRSDPQLKWGEKKHQKLEIIQKVLHCQGGWDCSAWFALLEPKITRTMCAQFRFKNFGDDVSLGICHKSIVEKLRYQSTDQMENIGHGFYIMSCNGRLYSHIDAMINKKKNGFLIQVNEILTLIADIDTQTLKISNGIDEVQMKFKVEDDLYFVVQLSNKNDQIELL